MNPRSKAGVGERNVGLTPYLNDLARKWLRSYLGLPEGLEPFEGDVLSLEALLRQVQRRTEP